MKYTQEIMFSRLELLDKMFAEGVITVSQYFEIKTNIIKKLLRDLK